MRAIFSWLFLIPTCSRVHLMTLHRVHPVRWVVLYYRGILEACSGAKERSALAKVIRQKYTYIFHSTTNTHYTALIYFTLILLLIPIRSSRVHLMTLHQVHPVRWVELYYRGILEACSGAKEKMLNEWITQRSTPCSWPQ